MGDNEIVVDGNRPWRWLAGVIAVAVVGGAFGAYFGLRASRGGAAGTASVNPSPRTGAAVAYDGATGTVVLFGGLGQSDTVLGDTWTWDGHTWTQQHPTTSPPAREAGLMAYDPQSHDLVLIGGVLATGWSGSSTGCAVAGGVGGGAVVTTAPPSPCPTPSPTAAAAAIDATWTWNGGDWHRVDGVRPSIFGAQMATDPATGHIVVVTSPGPVPELGMPAIACPLKVGAVPDGTNLCGGGPFPYNRSETWVWRDGGWHRSTAVGPVSVPGQLAVDPRSGRLAYFTMSVTSCAIPVTVPPSATVPPVVSAPGQLALPTCPIEGAMRGIAGGATESTWNGASWASASSIGAPPDAFTGGSLATDLARHQLVFVSEAVRATWTFDGSWRTTSPRTPPPPAQGAALTYDAATGEVVMFGGAVAAGLSSETWTWDGSNWTLVSGKISPTPTPVPPGAPGTAVPLPAPAPASPPSASPPSASPPVLVSPCPSPAPHAPSGPGTIEPFCPVPPG